MPVTIISSIANYPASNPAITARILLQHGTVAINGAGAGSSVTMGLLNTASFTFSDTIAAGLYEVRYYTSTAQLGSGIVWIESASTGSYKVDDPIRMAIYQQRLQQNLESPERATTDTRALEFDWLIGQTFANSASTCTRLFPGESAASAEALTGAITLVRTGRYAIAYAVADRVQTGSTVIPTEVLYTLVDDLGNIGYLTLRVTSRAVIGDVAVLPLVGTVQARVEGTNISLFTAETPTVAILVVDTLGASVNLTAMVLSIVFENRYGANVATIADANITRVGSTISFVVPSAVTTIATTLNWSLRNGTSMLLRGYADIVYAAEA